ncbi:MAG: elongation factor P [Myxococcota bacterium]
MDVSPSDFRKGLKVLWEGQPYSVVDYQFVKPGKGAAFTRTKLKNLLSGNVVEYNIRSGDKLEVANTEELKMVYLYKEGDDYTFMNQENYEQLTITEEQLGGAHRFLTENIQVDVLLYNDRPIAVELPNFVELEIVYCEPGVKGDTATGASKPATLSTGAIVNVPLFIEQGEIIRIDTREEKYMERVKAPGRKG